MVLVSEYPGEDRGALGVVTLEDVIEELIGEYVTDLPGIIFLKGDSELTTLTGKSLTNRMSLLMFTRR